MFNLLILDDDLDMANSIKSYFLGDNKDIFKIDIVNNVDDGIECMKKSIDTGNLYDVIIQDIMMQPKDGIYFLNQLNISNLKLSTKIIIYTSIINKTMQREILEYDIDFLFMKPYDLLDLKERVIKLCLPFGSEMQIRPKIYSKNEYVAYAINCIYNKKDLIGSKYLFETINICITDYTKMFSVTKDLYSEAGDMCGATGIAVERGIKNFIDKGWENDKLKKFCSFVNVEYMGKKSTVANIITSIVIGWQNHK